MHEITYGQTRQLKIEAGAGTVLLRCGDPHGEALDDPQAAVAASLVEPCDFPPLAQATVPGDSVVIALHTGVPQAPAVVSGIVQALAEADVAPRNICVLVTVAASHQCDAIRAALPRSVSADVCVDVHDPQRSDQLAYLAASRRGDPILMSRRLCDADVVIPVGCLRPEGAWGASNATLGVFPAFADEATARRFQAPAEWSSERRELAAADEIAEATWLLGVRFTVQVISAAGDQVLHVISGDIDAVGRHGNRLARQAWEFPVSEPADLVVAAISGGGDQQTWENVSRALFAASRVVQDDGAIVVASELRERPGPAMRRLVNADDLDATRHQLWKDQAYDARWANQVASTLQSVRVYLLSQLVDDLVEDLGIAPVEQPEDIANLCRRAKRCLLLANSQHALPTLDGHKLVRL